MNLAEQMQILADADIALMPGITSDDLTAVFALEDYERDPLRLLFFTYGTEVEQVGSWLRISNDVWDFDMEYIVEPESYVEILQNLVGLTGEPALLQDANAELDASSANDMLRYRLGDNRFEEPFVMNSDWADPDTIDQLMRQIEATLSDGRVFWAQDNGQAMVLAFMSEQAAGTINSVLNGMLFPVVGR